MLYGSPSTSAGIAAPVLKTYRVTARREFSGGGSVELLSTSFGRDEAHARRVWLKSLNHAAISNGMDRQMWADHELKFEEVK